MIKKSENQNRKNSHSTKGHAIRITNQHSLKNYSTDILLLAASTLSCCISKNQFLKILLYTLYAVIWKMANYCDLGPQGYVHMPFMLW